MSALLNGQRYVGTTTGTQNGKRFYRDVEFTASRDQEVEPFIRDRASVPDQDRVFRQCHNFGSVPVLVVAGSLRAVTA